MITIFTKPKELVNFAWFAVALNNKSDGVGGALWRVGNAGRKQKHLSFPDMDSLRLSFFIDNLDTDVTFDLVEKLLAFLPVIVFAAIGASYDHDDIIVVAFV